MQTALEMEIFKDIKYCKRKYFEKKLKYFKEKTGNQKLSLQFKWQYYRAQVLYHISMINPK